MRQPINIIHERDETFVTKDFIIRYQIEILPLIASHQAIKREDETSNSGNTYQSIFSRKLQPECIFAINENWWDRILHFPIQMAMQQSQF